jgi:hypothetical protein
MWKSGGTIFYGLGKDSSQLPKNDLFLEPEQMIISSEECPNGENLSIPHEQIILNEVIFKSFPSQL